MTEHQVGRSELAVSPIAFGTSQLGGDWGATDEESAVAAIPAANLELDASALRWIEDIISDEVRVGGPSAESV